MHVSSPAKRYARALARVAIAGKLEKTVGVELQGLRDWFTETPAARLSLESPATRSETKKRAIEQIAKALPQLSHFTRNTLEALVEHQRFQLFDEVVEGYRREVDSYHDVVEVSVVSATPLDESQREALKGTLQRTIGGGKDVRLDLSLDPRLIAGVIARVGSVVYDGSLRQQLGQIRQQLISE